MHHIHVDHAMSCERSLLSYPLRKLRPSRGKAPEDSGRRIRMEIHKPFRVTVRGWCPHGIGMDTCEKRVMERVLSLRSRTQALIRETPEVPPDHPDAPDSDGHFYTVYEAHAMRMAAWHRRYICLVPAIKRATLKAP